MRRRESGFGANSTLPTDQRNEGNVAMTLSLMYAPNGCVRRVDKWVMDVGSEGLAVLCSTDA